jgi:deazaflavin-dependent oxidoreductase (nitroreductase family)
MAELDTRSKRFWKWLTNSGFYKKFGKLHVPVYRMSGGLLGHRMGVSNLLLTTKGRKTGNPRTVPLTYTEDGGRWVVVGSHGGADSHPVWWLNLQAERSATVMVGRETFPVMAREAEGEERERLWRKACTPLSNYDRYQSLTDRHIPVVILERT